MRLVRVLVAAVLAAALVLTGCDRRIEGRPLVGSRDGDPGYFFAGDVDVFGQNVSAGDRTELAYLRALRRVDVCGLLSRDILAKVGQLVSVATLYAFNECDAALKLPTASGHKLLSVELVMADRPENAAAFLVGDTPVYRNSHGCQYLVPVPLSELPASERLLKPRQPFVRIGLIVEDDCALVQRVANAIAQRVSTRPLPARDGAAVYPSALAGRDPCEVLGQLGADVSHWDIDGAQPHECQFSIRRQGFDHALSVVLQPHAVDSTTQGRQLLQRDGVEVYLNQTPCSAVSFVGPPMQQRVIGVGFVDLTNVVVRPAVVVESDGDNCEAVADVAARAAKLYS